MPAPREPSAARPHSTWRVGVVVALLVTLATAAGCSNSPAARDVGGASTPRQGVAASPPAPSPSAPPPAPAETPAPADTPAGTARPSDGRPAEARLSIPSIGIRDLVVEPYVGWTDDRPGTDIQDRGRAASPHGPRGGTGPGGVGNYQVTAHRNSATAAFLDLPELDEGARVHVDAGGVRYTYRVTATRQTSFRSARSLAEQRAPVPGDPGATPTEAMVTLSTCATQEDHAVGNYWSDEFDNPEHRIDKVGVLISTTPATGGA